jgi:methylated-DNA-[protein]-cysteine S-methyltransferase
MMLGQRVIAWSEMDSPVGPLTLAMTARGICYIDFGAGERAQMNLKVWTYRRFHTVRLERKDRELEPAALQLKEYFDGNRRQFDLPIDLYGTPFQLRVWRELQSIPFGEVRSYKEVARAIGAPKAVRAVGGANNKNPVPILVPCHRVIGSNGSLVGYGGGLSIKEHLLKLEGALPQDLRK